MLPLQVILGPEVVHLTSSRDFIIIYLYHSYERVLYSTMSLLCSPPALVSFSPSLVSSPWLVAVLSRCPWATPLILSELNLGWLELQT